MRYELKKADFFIRISFTHGLKRDTLAMNGAEFIRRIRKLGKRRGKTVSISRWHGKGSHVELLFGQRRTFVKHGEIAEGLLNAMLKQLGLTKKDLR